MGCGAPTVNGVPVDEGVVVGGSGAEYASIAAGQAGEAEQSAADTTAAGTVAGTVIATVVPAWLAVGDIVVLTDVTPGNGLTCLYAVIRAIAGTTLTIDKPWNFGVGEGITYIRPIILTLNRPQTENVTFTKNVIFNLAGNVLSGSIDGTGGAYRLVNGGGGIVSNGITTTNLSVTIMVDIAYVGRRAGTNYAYIMTNGSNIGATETYNCGFGGIVSGRRGYGRWIIDDCQNDGVAETDQNCPWRPFESVAGIAVVITNAAVQINSKYSGCIFYSENSITGATAVIQIAANITLPEATAGNIDPIQQPTNYFTCWANGAATLTITQVNASSTSRVTISGLSFGFLAAQTGEVVVGHMNHVNFTGISNVTIGIAYAIGAGSSIPVAAIIHTQGSATTTGSMTNGITTIWDAPDIGIAYVVFCSPFTGTIAGTGGFTVYDGAQVRQLWGITSVAAISGAASITISGTCTVRYCLNFTLASFVGVVSAGTFAFTGSYFMNASTGSSLFNIGSTVSGGTWTVTNTISIELLGRGVTTNTALFGSQATGGTFTISSAIVRVSGLQTSSIFVIGVTGAGGSVTVTSAVSVFIRGFNFRTSNQLVLASTATSTAAMQGTLEFEECEFTASTVILEATLGGGVAEIRNITFNNCIFDSTLTGEAGAGTRTYVGELRMRNCHCKGLVTVILGVGAAASGFTVFETWETAFEGSSGNKSIAATGVRPTVAGAYRHWRPSMKALINDLKPEVIREWSVLPNAAVISNWGALSTINAAAASIVCVAASIFEGVVLDTTAGVGGEPVITVTDGDIFVKVDATVAAGDNLIIDPAVPAQGILGVFTGGQNVGRALEAAAGTFAGKSYTRVCAR